MPNLVTLDRTKQKSSSIQRCLSTSLIKLPSSPLELTSVRETFFVLHLTTVKIHETDLAVADVLVVVVADVVADVLVVAVTDVIVDVASR